VKVIEKGYSGLFFNSLELLQKLRATIDGGNGGLSEDDLLEEIASVDLLVFDDLGAEKVSDYVKDRFYLVVNKRYEDCRPIIVTTNLTLQELENRMGERLVSRLLEMCVKFQIFPKEDFRQRCLGEDRGRSKSGSSVD
jgi:DNA replication protein DnaC